MESRRTYGERRAESCAEPGITRKHPDTQASGEFARLRRTSGAGSICMSRHPRAAALARGNFPPLRWSEFRPECLFGGTRARHSWGGSGPLPISACLTSSAIGVPHSGQMPLELPVRS